MSAEVPRNDGSQINVEPFYQLSSQCALSTGVYCQFFFIIIAMTTGIQCINAYMNMSAQDKSGNQVSKL